MTDKGCPLITRYEQTVAPEGYMFFLIDNKDPNGSFKEIVNFTLFDGLEIIGSDEKKYQLEVGPNETKIILIRASFKHYNMGYSRAQSVNFGDAKL